MASTALSVLSLLTLVAGYSFDITAAPTQCGPLSLQITGGSGKPPYTALIVPYGASPTPTEQRKVFQQQFSGDSTSFTMPFPVDSNFVVMLSDSTGVGTGGTSVPTSVAASSNSSCLPNSVSTSFSFQIIPNNAINQCEQTTLAWDSGAQGTVTIFLVIPGGQSSSIPTSGAKGGLQGNTTGFLWTPDIRAGTNVLLVVGDSRGPGTGGSVNTAVGNSPDSNSTCITNDSPSSTAGTPAGAIETGSSGKGGNGGNDGGSTTNVGAIAGGVVGGLAAIVIVGLVALFFLRRRRRQRHPAAHGVDLLPEGAHRDTEQPPEFYHPEPFIVPPHSHTDAEENGGASAGRPSMSDAGGRRYSALSTTDQSESAYGTTTGTGTNLLAVGAGAGSRSTSYGPGSSRKSPAGPPQLRPVNFVQHEDAGEIPEPSGSAQHDEPETIELPPSYTNIRR